VGVEEMVDSSDVFFVLRAMDEPEDVASQKSSGLESYIENALAWFRDANFTPQHPIINPHIWKGFSKAFLSFLVPTVLLTRKVRFAMQLRLFVLTKQDNGTKLAKSYGVGSLCGWR
jgi:hypothetical protein